MFESRFFRFAILMMVFNLHFISGINSLVMKLIVFLRIYLFPLLLAVLFAIRINIGISPFSVFGGAVFVFAVTMVALLTDKRYVQKFVIDNDILRISYTNHFLQQKTIEFEISKITDLKLSKRRIIAPIWPPELNIIYDGEWKNFSILSKEIYAEVESQVSNRISLMGQR